VTPGFEFDDLDLSVLERRRRTAKWRRHGPGTIAAWVADMDLPIAPAVTRALHGAVDAGELGYPATEAAADLAVVYADWARRRHGWRPDPALTVAVADVVGGVASALDAVCQPGSAVVTLTPAYPPFFGVVEASRRRLVSVPLRDEPDGWHLDVDAVSAAFAAGARVLLLCHPHNPTGRVFTVAELRLLADAAARYDVMVLADEIHGDLALPGARHVPFASLGPDVAARTVTFVSASKAFNLAGLHCALVVAGDPAVAARIRAVPGHRRGAPSILGLAAAQAAWTEGDDWLAAALAHFGRQRQRLADLLAGLPALRWHPPEGTYLAWLDCRRLDLPAGSEPAPWLLEHAKVALYDGRQFGPEGIGWARLNLATSGPILDEIVDRMARALEPA
jgi:cystathionine beta-lyase